MSKFSSEENLLLDFLHKYPWTSRQILIAVFGSSFDGLVNKSQVRVVRVPGVGECWGVKQEKLSSLPGARRRELAKDHIVKARGKDALWAGSSPGPWGADLIFYQRSTERWTRVWVDHGEVSVEAAPL